MQNQNHIFWHVGAGSNESMKCSNERLGAAFCWLLSVAASLEHFPPCVFPHSRHKPCLVLCTLFPCSRHSFPCPRLSKASTLITSLRDPNLSISCPIAHPYHSQVYKPVSVTRWLKSSLTPWDLGLDTTVENAISSFPLFSLSGLHPHFRCHSTFSIHCFLVLCRKEDEFDFILYLGRKK